MSRNEAIVQLWPWRFCHVEQVNDLPCFPLAALMELVGPADFGAVNEECIGTLIVEAVANG